MCRESIRNISEDAERDTDLDMIVGLTDKSFGILDLRSDRGAADMFRILDVRGRNTKFRERDVRDGMTTHCLRECIILR